MRAIKYLLPLPLMLSACASVPSANIDNDVVAEVEQTQRVAGLNMLTRLNIPDYAKTVKAAAEYVLSPTEYTLMTSCGGCPVESKTIAEQPISALAQGNDVMTVNRALLTISGYETGLIIDEVNKKVAFKKVEEK